MRISVEKKEEGLERRRRSEENRTIENLGHLHVLEARRAYWKYR